MINSSCYHLNLQLNERGSFFTHQCTDISRLPRDSDRVVCRRRWLLWLHCGYCRQLQTPASNMLDRCPIVGPFTLYSSPLPWICRYVKESYVILKLSTEILKEMDHCCPILSYIFLLKFFSMVMCGFHLDKVKKAERCDYQLGVKVPR